jgi:hypothetical protein
MLVPRSRAIPHDLSVYAEKGDFDRRRAPYAPEQRRQSQHQFAFDRRLSVVVRDDGSLESFVVLDVFDRSNDGFGA